MNNLQGALSEIEEVLKKIQAIRDAVPDGLDRYEHKTSGYQVKMARECVKLLHAITGEKE